MSHALRHAILFFLGLVVLDRGLGAALFGLHAQVRTGEGAGKVRQILESRAEILLLGSSRVRQHLDPDLLREATGHPTFNGGANGQSLAYVVGVTELALRAEHPPRCIVVNVDIDDLTDPQLGRAKVLTPYVDRTGVADVLRAGDPWLPVKRVSWLWRFNGLVLPMLRNVVRPRDSTTDGYAPRHGRLADVPLDRRPHQELPETLEVDPDAIALLEHLVRTTRDAGVNLTWISAPFHELDDDPGLHPLRQEAAEVLATIGTRESVPTVSFDEVRYPMLAPIELYADPAHLNQEGATLYSRLVGEALPTLCGL